MESLCHDGAGFFAGGDEGVAVGDTGQQRGDVGGGDDFEEGVGGVVLEAADFGGGVIKRQTFPRGERSYSSFVEALFANHAEVILVPEVNQPHDPPEVVDPVRVIKRHAPAVRLGRETPQKEDACAFGQEWLEWMFFYGHMLQR